MAYIKLIVIALVFGIMGGALSTLIFSKIQTRSQNDLIGDFYMIENAVHISPHSLRGRMDKGAKDFVLVDLRSAQEYETEHIVGAINIPAYKDPKTSAYDEVDRIVGNFSLLPKDKETIVYCYSVPCMTGRKIGLMLAQHGIYVKQLGIGWNEWRYFWDLWNHEIDWNTTKVGDYIWNGTEPGVPKIKNKPTVCIDGQFGC